MAQSTKLTAWQGRSDVLRTSPFSESASTYWEQGLAVVPCGPGTKFPGRYTAADGWWKAHDWQKYSDRLPTNFEMEIWERWPEAGICLVLGASSAPAGKVLVAMDIDTLEPAEVAAIKSVLPGSPVAKKGAKGETQFYLANPCVTNTAFNDGNKRRMLDLLAHGRQTVMPPTMHPDTGAPYHWLTPDTLEDFNVADLPELPDDIVERLGRALEPFGYKEPPKLGAAGDVTLEGEKVHRALNDSALANLDAWVPALSLYKCKKVGAGYKAVADWRPSSSGRPLAKRATNLAIRHDGIKDCGEGKGYTPLDVVMAVCACDLEAAFRWLQERVAADKPVILGVGNRSSHPDEARLEEEGQSTRPMLPSCEREESSIVRTSPKGNLAFLRVITRNGERVDDEEIPHSRAPVLNAATEEDTLTRFNLETEPGLLGDLARWSQVYAFRPVREFALPAAIAAGGAIFGRRLVTPSGLGLNLYLIAIAETGGGKDALLGAAKVLLAKAGLRHLIGPGDFSSDAALETSLRMHPSQLMPLDEFGKLMQAVNGRNSPVWAKLAAKALLEIHPRSQPGSEWSGKQKADPARDNASEPVFSPTLSILGVSTPEGFFEGMTQQTLEDGFLNRLTVFRAGAAGPRQRDAARLEPPADLIKRLQASYSASGPAGDLAEAKARSATAEPPLRFARWADDDALSALEEVEAWEDAAADAGRRGVCGRAAEQTQKIATIRAAFRDPADPAVTAEDVRWAFVMVKASIEIIEEGARSMVAGSEFESLCNCIMAALEKAGRKGLAMSLLLRAKGVAKAKPRDVNDALQRLSQTHRIFLNAGGANRVRKRFLDETIEDC